jgi:hypothetical protein
MRRLLFSMGVGAIVAVAAVGRAQAQMPLNIVAGPTFANVSGDDVPDDNSSKTGFFVAAGTAFSINETFSIDPWVGYVQKGTSFDDGDFSLDYIEIPVFLSATIPVGESASLGISAGPQIAFNVNCDENGDDCSEDSDFKSTEFGIVGAASIAFPLSDSVGLSLGGAADFGLTDVFDNSDGKTRTYYLFAGLGFALGGGM